MFYFDVPNQIAFLIILCSSFYIFSFSSAIIKTKSLPRLMGISFFIPLFLCTASFFTLRGIISNSLLVLSELAFLFMLFLLLAVKPSSKSFGFFAALIFAIPTALLFVILYINVVPGYLISAYVNIPAFITFTVLSMFLLRKDNSLTGMLFWPMLFILAASITGAFGASAILVYISLGLKFFAYLIFIVYFNRYHISTIPVVPTESERRQSRYGNASLGIRSTDGPRGAENVGKASNSSQAVPDAKAPDTSKLDPVTKLPVKEAIVDTINTHISSKSQNQFCILLFEVDNLTSINSSHGLPGVEKCLKKLALMSRHTIRPTDILGRYEDNKFIIVLPGTTLQQGRIAAERLRRRMSESESPHFTISCGIAGFPSDSSTVDALLADAAQGLKAAVDKGRNVVSHKSLF